MDEKQALEQLARQVKDYAKGLGKDVARGAETRQSAVLLLKGYGRGLIDAVALIYDSSQAVDALGYVLDGEISKIDPDWREHDRELGDRHTVTAAARDGTSEQRG
ncbi:hypothetical protein [Acidovorax sp. SDU_ACID1]|uniref:hypothetical protein n=1 Tax=Acidovorax sp. SDU_ACID1 TaxID=3136632 RepID=UPI0038735E69